MRRVELAALLLLTAASVAMALPAQLQGRLSQLPATLQRQLQARDALWTALPPGARESMRRRIAAWDTMPEAERRLQRERWEAWQALPPDQKLAVQAAALAFAALPADQQQALRSQYAQRDATDHHGWLLGPALGADFDGLQPLLLQVPPAQRQPLLDALHAMTPPERADLAVLAQRTPPQQRDALRRGLLSTSDANRAAWLQAQLER